MLKKLITKTPGETKALAKKIASRLKGDEILALRGDLGAGKTTFIQGLAEGLGIKQKVISPTFVLQRIYRGQKCFLFHYDFYRLSSAEVKDLDLREILGRGVVAIEWPERVNTLPKDAILVTIQERGEKIRAFTFALPPNKEYCLSSFK